MKSTQLNCHPMQTQGRSFVSLALLLQLFLKAKWQTFLVKEQTSILCILLSAVGEPQAHPSPWGIQLRPRSEQATENRREHKAVVEKPPCLEGLDWQLLGATSPNASNSATANNFLTYPRKEIKSTPCRHLPKIAFNGQRYSVVRASVVCGKHWTTNRRAG